MGDSARRRRSPACPGPGWRRLAAEYGWEGIDGDAYRDWQGQRRPQTHGQPPRKAADSPEPQSLPALVAAWRNGLDTVVVLPYAGFFARRITNRHLAASAETRNAPASYTQALDSWTRLS
ncbi:hypothetical protein AB0N24_13245 [Arthrobacter sp. NPDC093128]|uniref:hypothetical protein n=1 Tax=Arthrobacter sp. NPDC093128 TaxID=3154979 RepID=UPI0034234581